MPSRTTPKLLYTDHSRLCARCGVVVLPHAAYCSTCGAAQSLRYTRWQVWGQIMRLWLAVVVVWYGVFWLWRWFIPFGVVLVPACATETSAVLWLTSMTSASVTSWLGVSACGTVLPAQSIALVTIPAPFATVALAGMAFLGGMLTEILRYEHLLWLSLTSSVAWVWTWVTNFFA